MKMLSITVYIQLAPGECMNRSRFVRVKAFQLWSAIAVELRNLTVTRGHFLSLI